MKPKTPNPLRPEQVAFQFRNPTGGVQRLVFFYDRFSRDKDCYAAMARSEQDRDMAIANLAQRGIPAEPYPDNEYVPILHVKGKEAADALVALWNTKQKTPAADALSVEQITTSARMLQAVSRAGAS